MVAAQRVQGGEIQVKESKSVVVPLGAKKFTYRLADPCMPLKDRKQDRHFPAIDKLSYDNYIVAVNELPNSLEYQFTLADGANCGSKGSGNKWTSRKIS